MTKDLMELYPCEEDMLKFMSDACDKEGVVAISVTMTVMLNSGVVYSRTGGASRETDFDLQIAREVHAMALTDIVNGDTTNVEPGISGRAH